jgi:hypothetical protein
LYQLAWSRRDAPALQGDTMRLERTIAVLVLATGVMCAGAAMAAEQQGEAPPPVNLGVPDVKYPPGSKTEVGYNQWAATEIAPEHAVLARLAGKFKSKVVTYKPPTKSPKVPEGTAEGKLLMGGAFVQFNQSEPRAKQPFEGMTIYGFDQASRKYTAASIESNSTVIANFIGTYDAEKKQLVLTARYSGQKSRTLVIIRRVITFVDATSWTLEDFESHKPGDKEEKLVTITFTN